MQGLDQLLRRAARMPRKTNAALAECFAGIWHRMDKRHRTIVLSNLERAFGDELTGPEREAICRGVFGHLSRVIFEAPYLWTLSPETVDEFVVFEGLEHVKNALHKGKGLLLMSCHFGNWELMSLAFSMKGLPCNVVYRPLDNPRLNTLINLVRSRGGNRMIPKKGSVREMLRWIHRNQIVALLVDQNVDWYDGVFVPFFKDIACTNKALAVLALRTGAPVIPIMNARRPDGRYHAVAEPEVELIRTGDLIADTEENTALFNRIIERNVRRHPEQWFWVHQRWKTRPYQSWPMQ